jgi:hypothetical protein
MTPEEAAEIVLQNDPWEPCTKEHLGHECECDFSGALLKDIYKEAYQLLGLPHPPLWTRTALPNGGYRESGPAIFSASSLTKYTFLVKKP